MDTVSVIIIVVIFILICCSIFFGASETAFSALNRIKLKSIASQGNKRAVLALKLTEHYDKLLSAVLIGNNTVNITSSVLATVLFVKWFGNAGVSIATLVMTLLLIFIAEISPKTLAKEAPEKVAIFAAPILMVLIFILTPLNKVLGLWKHYLIRFFKLYKKQGVTQAELLTFVEEVRQDGGINEGEEDMIRRTIAFDDCIAQDIYTPRIDIVAVSMSDSIDEIDKAFYMSGYSRLPVYKDSIDSIVGFILLKDFHHKIIGQKQNLESIVQSAVFINKSMKVSKLLKTFQEKKCHLAVLVDEFGGTMGIITIEDILEELVGEIWDEHDDIEELITQINEKTFTVLGKTPLNELFDYFSIDEEDDKIRHTKVSNWVIENLNGTPKEGESFHFNHLLITLSKVHHHRVLEVTITVH